MSSVGHFIGTVVAATGILTSCIYNPEIVMAMQPNDVNAYSTSLGRKERTIADIEKCFPQTQKWGEAPKASPH